MRETMLNKTRHHFKNVLIIQYGSKSVKQFSIEYALQKETFTMSQYKMLESARTNYKLSFHCTYLSLYFRLLGTSVPSRSHPIHLFPSGFPALSTTFFIYVIILNYLLRCLVIDIFYILLFCDLLLYYSQLFLRYVLFGICSKFIFFIAGLFVNSSSTSKRRCR